ncbi:MAG: OmpH family outer membrane protein [Muribaculaceae bacterium]
MIKKILIAILIALPLAVTAQTVKIGVINIESLVQEDPQTAEAQKTLQEAQAKYASDIQKLDEEAQKAYDEYNKLKEDPNTPAAILQRHETSLQEMANKIQQHADTYQKDLQQQQYQLMAPIYDKIQKAAQAVGQENGFTLIVPQAAAVYMSADVVDVNPFVKAKIAAPAAK